MRFPKGWFKDLGIFDSRDKSESVSARKWADAVEGLESDDPLTGQNARRSLFGISGQPSEEDRRP